MPLGADVRGVLRARGRQRLPRVRAEAVASCRARRMVGRRRRAGGRVVMVTTRDTLLVTGSREWTDLQTIDHWVDRIVASWHGDLARLVHGDARGVDREVARSFCR